MKGLTALAIMLLLVGNVAMAGDSRPGPADTAPRDPDPIVLYANDVSAAPEMGVPGETLRIKLCEEGSVTTCIQIDLPNTVVRQMIDDLARWADYGFDPGNGTLIFRYPYL